MIEMFLPAANRRSVVDHSRRALRPIWPVRQRRRGAMGADDEEQSERRERGRERTLCDCAGPQAVRQDWATMRRPASAE